ncbi:amino acid adenylation domain-containing protein [Actinoplanes sp. NPDC051859]|uniref:amino acid adenylation domain-containing protein n=1 Tax=Actinoplanes sp. NPDC051859 TaxID=3363909 RepID=UPI00378FC0E1
MAELFPVTSSQERLVVIERLFPGSAAYHLPFALRLRGTVDAAALVAAVHDVVRRHEALRTVIRTVHGEILQEIRDDHRIDVPVRDIRGADEAQVLQAGAREPFDLTAGLIRVSLLRTGDDEHVLAVTIHHLAGDMWSCGIFVREVAEAYRSRLAGDEAQLPELPVQYVDYTVWQRERLTPEVVAREAAYWREELRDAPPLLELPGDRPRPATQTFRGATAPVMLSPELSRQVDRVSRRLGVTPFMTLLAAYQAVLGRWTGGDDIVVSSGLSARTPQVEELIGYFADLVVFRTSLAGDPTFTELVGRVRRTVLGGFEHQELPFERLVEEVAPRRDLSHQPLTQVMFLLQNAPMPVPVLTGLEVSSVPVDRAATQVDVSLQLWAAPDRYEGHLEYSTDLFDAATMARLSAWLETFLTAALDDPETRLSALPILRDDQVNMAVEDWNRTAAPVTEATFPDLFHRQARATPAAIAVVHSGGETTYAELAAQVDALSRRLRAAGAGPGTVVGSCLRPGPDRLVAFLGIMDAGAAYLPLDPDFPPDRLSFLLADAAPVLLVAPEGSDLPGGVPVLPPAGPDVPDPGRVRALTPADLAYLMFTSGSTGQPKGILLTHRGVVNNVLDTNRRAGFTPADRVLAVSAVTFDMSVYEMLGPLLAGGAVVWGEPDRAKDPRHWADRIRAHRVTVWNSAPSLLEALLEHAPPGALAGLRVAMVGGDWVAVSLPERARKHAPGLTFLVNSGVTEVSIQSVSFAVTDADPGWASIPYGRPMENQTALILDPCGRVVPPGVVGEIHFGGIGLAWGYHRRPGLTAERFVPHPYAGTSPGVPSGARLYRTGDLGRYGPDGLIELLGRVDHQVKIRGFRIELGEVETALRSHPGVAEGVVTVHRDGMDQHLAAFYVAAGSPTTVADLRAHLKRTLPDYMVPASFTVLPKLPLSAAGKVDRKALPAPGAISREAAAVTFEAPRDEVESVLAGLWSEVLPVDKVGVHDDFFALGGYSLAAIRIVALAGEVFGVDVPLRAVFDAPTVAGQAAVLREQCRAQGIDLDRTVQLLADLEQLSDDEVTARLAG